MNKELEIIAHIARTTEPALDKRVEKFFDFARAYGITKEENKVYWMGDYVGTIVEDENEGGKKEMKTKETDGFGITYYYNKKGQFHRTNGPAVIRASGSKVYYVDGKLHRTNGPARIWADGSEEYWVDGKRHRTDGPAVIYADGYKEYWVDGKLHRTDGPAVIYSNGSKEYWVDGKRHRTNGPAVICHDGSEEYWVDGKLHRTNGPAVIWADGSEVYYVDGERHRTDGPAVIRANGYKEYWVDGKRLEHLEILGSRSTLLVVGNGPVKIGCETHVIDYWLKNYKEIGREHEYTKSQICEYHQYLKIAKKFIDQLKEE